jgi:hypothetical protein
MGRYICSLLKSAMNVSRRQRSMRVDAVLLMGGNIRGGTDYKSQPFFSLEALEAEINADETLGIVPMPGWLVEAGTVATHSGPPIPGWMQYDVDVIETDDGRITHVGGEALDPQRMYRVATKIGDLTNGQSAPLTSYYKANPELIPPKGAYVNIHAELMGYFARNFWRKIWEAVAPVLSGTGETCETNPSMECDASGRLFRLTDGSEEVTVDDIHRTLGSKIGLSMHPEEKSLARFIHSFADVTGDGKVTLADLEAFCSEQTEMYENDKWRLSHSKQSG